MNTESEDQETFLPFHFFSVSSFISTLLLPSAASSLWCPQPDPIRLTFSRLPTNLCSLSSNALSFWDDFQSYCSLYQTTGEAPLISLGYKDTGQGQPAQVFQEIKTKTESFFCASPHTSSSSISKNHMKPEQSGNQRKAVKKKTNEHMWLGPGEILIWSCVYKLFQSH